MHYEPQKPLSRRLYKRNYNFGEQYLVHSIRWLDLQQGNSKLTHLLVREYTSCCVIPL